MMIRLCTKKDICLTGANVFSIFINSINKIKQCCLQLWKDEKSFWKQFFCDKHLLFQLWKSRRRCAKSSLSSFSVFSGNCSFHFFTAVFTLDLIALFLAAFVSFTKILFLADLMLANAYTSKYIYDFKCNLSFRRLGHGRSAETYSFILCQL